MTAGSQTDLLTGILNVQIRNEEKITEQDRRYCQRQQELLYKTLDQIDKWYAIFREDAERYREEKKFTYEDNGKISIRNFHFNYNEKEDYTHNEFKPFDIINELVNSNCNANANFANRIVSYFNKTYNVAVPVPEIDGKTLRMGFRPVYETYVDAVIEHLGGKSFRKTAEEELLARFLKTVRPSRWSKVKPELKMTGLSCRTYSGSTTSTSSIASNTISVTVTTEIWKTSVKESLMEPTTYSTAVPK